MSYLNTRTSITERFLERVDTKTDLHSMNELIEVPGNCWIWTGTVNKGNGYGHASFRGSLNGVPVNGVVAHRLSYMLFVGRIPDNSDIDHLCFRRDCVRPSHLEAVSHTLNVQRSRFNNWMKQLNRILVGDHEDMASAYGYVTDRK